MSISSKEEAELNKPLSIYDDDDFADDDDDDDNNTGGGKIVGSDLETIREEDSVRSDTSNTTRSRSTVTNNLKSLLLFAFPRGDPVSWKNFIVLTLAILFPSFIYLLFFTKMGIGLRTFYHISNTFLNVYQYVSLGLFVFIFLLYLLDFTYWTTRKGIWIRRICWVIFVVGIIFVVLCLANHYPYGPISIFTILMPVWLMMIKDLFYEENEVRQYVRWLSFPFFTASILIGCSWVIWTCLREENRWNQVNRLRDSLLSGCIPNLKDYPQCRDSISGGDPNDVCFEPFNSTTILFHPFCDKTCTNVYFGGNCLNTFIIWVGPLMVSASLFFFSFFCTFLRTTTTPKDGTIVKEVVNFGKLWLILLFIVWITAAYAGVGPQGIVSALAALTLAGFIGSMVFLTKVLSQQDQQDTMGNLRDQLKSKYGAFMDVGRGLLVLTCTPLLVPYVFMSILIQAVRRSECFPYSKTIKELKSEDGGLLNYITDETRTAIKEFRKWDRTKVYTYAIYWGIGFLTLQVLITKFIYLFMSWLIEAIKPLGIPLITFIMILVGITLFLLPPVPGTPIFLALGAISVGTFEEKLTLVGAIFYAIVVSLFIKLCSNVLQQKFIGEYLSHYVRVRQLVRINSNFVRAMKLVMHEPQTFSLTKSCVFVGGPDWPTSVMCGIIRVNYGVMLLGTLPVLILIIPMVLSASFAYMAGVTENGQLKYPWAGTSSIVVLAIAIGTQFGSFLLAALALEQVMVERADELEEIPLDEEVKKVDKIVKQKNKAYREVTRWENLSIFLKISLSGSLTCMIVSCYLVQLFQPMCFREFDLSSKIADLPEGDWKRIVLPLGVVVLVLLLLSSIGLIIFIVWANRQAKAFQMAHPEEKTSLRPGDSITVDKTNLAVSDITTSVDDGTTEKFQRPATMVSFDADSSVSSGITVRSESSNVAQSGGIPLSSSKQPKSSGFARSGNPFADSQSTENSGFTVVSESGGDGGKNEVPFGQSENSADSGIVISESFTTKPSESVGGGKSEVPFGQSENSVDSGVVISESFTTKPSERS